MEQTVIKLNADNLTALPKEVGIPTYNRASIKAGIVHVGIGGFHRAHQAFYTDQLLQQHGVTDWGICGVALLDHDKKIYDTLAAQDGLYTLLITGADGVTNARVIGSIVEYLFAPNDPNAVIEKMAHPDIKIITLTITEGGYNFNPSTGEFMADNPAIRSDMANPNRPATIFGYLTQALKLRKERGLNGITVQSCDNIQQNGAVAREMLLVYISLAEPDLLNWATDHVSFPNAMVDRITPATSPEAIRLLKDQFMVDDAWPVVCEPFCQWIIEDNFINGRPEWDLAGAQFVTDVHPYEKMKIRLLNGGHVALGLTGFLNGYTYVDETLADPVFFRFLQDFLNKDVTPILDEVPGIDLSEYKKTLLQRFANPYIKDQLTRIMSQNSAKIPKFILPTLTEQLAKGVILNRAAVILAAWCHYLAVADLPENKFEVQDDMQQMLTQTAKRSVNGDALAFLKIKEIFGGLAESAGFSSAFVLCLDKISLQGIAKTLSFINDI